MIFTCTTVYCLAIVLTHLAILIYPIADGKVTNKFKRSFGTNRSFFSMERLKCVGILSFTMWSLFNKHICRKLRISLNAGVWRILTSRRAGLSAPAELRCSQLHSAVIRAHIWRCLSGLNWVAAPPENIVNMNNFIAYFYRIKVQRI